MLKLSLFYILCFTACFTPSLQTSDYDTYSTLNDKLPLVIAHRGASAYFPEHTIAAYELAIKQRADVIEPDLVMTKDHVLIARHEPMLSRSTNVASFPEFANRKTCKNVGGVVYNDWFAGDFTLAEIKRLGANQLDPERSQAYNGKFPIATLDELIALVKRKSKQQGRVISIYPEIKEPTFHKENNLPITDKLLATLKREGWTHKDSPVFVQCFEVATLQYVRSKSDVKIIQLINGENVTKSGRVLDLGEKPYDFVVSGDPRTWTDLATDKGLNFIKSYADGIGIWLRYVIPTTFQDCNDDGLPDDLNGDGVIDDRDYIGLPPTDLVKRAHKRNLLVHVWTLHNEPSGLLSNYKGDPKKLYKDFYRAGVDGMFTDTLDTAVAVRKMLRFNWKH